MGNTVSNLCCSYRSESLSTDLEDFSIQYSNDNGSCSFAMSRCGVKEISHKSGTDLDSWTPSKEFIPKMSFIHERISHEGRISFS